MNKYAKTGSCYVISLISHQILYTFTKKQFLYTIDYEECKGLIFFSLRNKTGSSFFDKPPNGSKELFYGSSYFFTFKLVCSVKANNVAYTFLKIQLQVFPTDFISVLEHLSSLSPGL